MTRVAPIVPAESDLLCEKCGYTLNGLSQQSNCPECGSPIEASVGARRQLPAWEQPSAANRIASFARTTLSVLFHPTSFYRTLATRASLNAVRRFAHIHWVLAAILFSAAASMHVMVFSAVGAQTLWYRFLSRPWGAVIMMLMIYLALYATTRLAAYLTAWEAAYRGIRLPMPVVLRGMYYHAAHYVPVALVAFGTVGGYRLLVVAHVTDLQTVTTYLYVLCGEVIVGAAYLFHTYWIGMRNMMYANR
jgi:hypothetical protein